MARWALVGVLSLLAACAEEGVVQCGCLLRYYDLSSFEGIRVHETEVVEVHGGAVDGIDVGDRTDPTPAGFLVAEDVVTLVDLRGAPRLAFGVENRLRVELDPMSGGERVVDARPQDANAMRIDLSRDLLGEPAALPLPAHVAIEPTSFLVRSLDADASLLPSYDRAGSVLHPVEVTTSYLVWDPASCTPVSASCSGAEVVIRHRFHRS
jgi:hypothetical protein